MKTEHVTLIGADPSTFAGLSQDEGSTAALPVFLLKVLEGPDEGKMLALDWTEASRALVGQSNAATLQLTDPLVSRRHLAIAPEGRLLRITDLGSTNGTRVGGIRIVEALLRGGETIELGGTVLRLQHTRATSGAPARESDSFGRVLGKSFEMQRAFTLAERLARTQLPILIEGESGTGKDLLAEAIHDISPMHRGPFVVLSGGAPHATLESIAKEAWGGTLVIDEPQELRSGLQAQLHSILDRAQNGIRTITLTKKDLDREVEAGRLAEDLLFRLAGARIEMPPLRRRHGDIELLAAHFWGLAGGEGTVPEELSRGFLDYHWPGNVRELRHAIDRAVAVGDRAFSREVSHRVTPGGDLVEEVIGMGLGLSQARAVVIEKFEERYVEDALSRHGGNVTRAAAASGCTRRYFHMLKKKQR